MNYKIVGEIRNIKNKGELKGTCFLINSEYILTAAHVLKGIDDTDDLNVIFKFIGVITKIKEVVYTNYDDIDFEILRLEDKIEIDINYSEIYATLPIEQGEFWETVGYPEDFKFDLKNDHNRYTYLNGTINRMIENEKCDYELSINDQKNVAEWQGLSGAPLFINNKIVGIITEEHLSKRLMTKIKIISIQKIIEFLVSKCEKKVVEVLSCKYKNLLNDRIDTFHNECIEKFLHFKNITIDFNSDCFLLRKEYKSKDIASMIDLFLIDYANELQDLILLEDEDLKIRRKQSRIVDKATNELKNQLIKDDKISLVLLWIILEGKYGSPRLASTYSLTNEELKQDIYICNNDDGIKLLIGYAEMQDNILDSIIKVLDEISKEKLGRSNKERIVIWDELAISYLDIGTKIQLKQIKDDVIRDDKLEIILLHSYSSEVYNNKQYKQNGDNNVLVEHLIKKELEKYNISITQLCAKYDWIKETKIHWILLPIESLNDFNNMLL